MARRQNYNQNHRPKADITKLRHKCPTGKVRFRDHQQSVAALHKAANYRANDLAERGISNRNEIRSYKCDACAGWHISSKTNWDSRKEAA